MNTLPKWLEAAQDDDPEVRRQAAQWVASTTVPPSEEVVVRLVLLLHDDALPVRAAAARALHVWGRGEAVPVLERQAQELRQRIAAGERSDDTMEAYATALTGLRWFATPRQESLFLDATTLDEASVLTAAAEGLVQLRTPNARRILREWLAESSVLRRRLAVRAVGELEDGEALPQLAALVERGDEVESSLFLETVRTLGRIRHGDAHSLLMQAMRQAPPAFLSTVVTAMARQGDARALESIQQGMEANNTTARKRAIEAMGQLRDPAAIPGLLAAARDASEYAVVRFYAVRALGQIGDSSVLPELLPLLDEFLEAPEEPVNYYDVAMAVVEAIGTFGAVEHLPVVLQALASSRDVVRDKACWVLADLGEASPAVLEALEAVREGQASQSLLVCWSRIALWSLQPEREPSLEWMDALCRGSEHLCDRLKQWEINLFRPFPTRGGLLQTLLRWSALWEPGLAWLQEHREAPSASFWHAVERHREQTTAFFRNGLLCLSTFDEQQEPLSDDEVTARDALQRQWQDLLGCITYDVIEGWRERLEDRMFDE